MTDELGTVPPTQPESAPETPQVQPAQAAPAAQPAQQPQPQGDEFHGVTREEMIHRYRELQTQHGNVSGEHKQLAEFARLVGPWFRASGDQVELNEEMVREYARQKNLLPEANAQNNGPTSNGHNTQAPTGNTEGDDMDNLDEQEKTAVMKMIEKYHQEQVTPHLSEMWKARGEQWMETLGQKYPDFGNWRNEAYNFAKKSNLQIKSLGDMENAYLAAKAIKGGFVDKNQHEALQQQLQAAQQVIQPAGGGFAGKAADPNAAENDLLGIDRLQKGDPQQDATAALFGKTVLKPG